MSNIWNLDVVEDHLLYSGSEAEAERTYKSCPYRYKF